MPKIGFTEEMLDTLRSMKGKTFKSYECNRDSFGERCSTFGNFRINLGRSSIDFSCYLERVEDYLGGPEDVATFSCVRVDPKTPFRPYVVDTAKTYMVDEVIKDVELVRDHVVNRNTENGDVCVIDMDVALVLRTKHHAFCFSIYLDLFEDICISVTDSESSNLGIRPLRELWEEDELIAVEASRELVRL